MASALLIILLIAVFALSVRGGAGRTAREGLGAAVRRFFQYGVQFALVCIVAVGISGLIGRVLQRNTLVEGDQQALAQGLSFTLVGVPLLWLIARWTMRRIAADPHETESLPWNWYVALAELVPLGVASMSLQTALLWAVGAGDYDGDAIARSVVWGAAWAVHRRVTRRTTALNAVRDHELAGAAYGLWSAAAGLASFIGAALQSLLAVSGKDLLVQGGSPIWSAVISMVIGIAVWIAYWIARVHASPRSLHWHVYVMLVGVGAGLVTAIVSASVVLYDILVWLVGTPDTSNASTHFRGTMTALGACLAGAIVWWYHRTVLRENGTTARDEAQRVYEYVVSLIALAAAAAGVMILLVAGIETLTSGAVLAGPGAGNTLLLALTLLVVGSPIWWWFWHGIQRVAREDTALEVASPTRRVYLLVMFGVVGVAALVALLIVVYQLFVDLVAGSLGTATLRSMRWGLGVLVTAAVVASYHWRVFRAERGTVPVLQRRHVVLVGPADDELVDALRKRLQAKVECWTRLDDVGAPWDIDAVIAAVEASPAEQAVVLMLDGEMRVLPVERG